MVGFNVLLFSRLNWDMEKDDNYILEVIYRYFDMKFIGKE